MTTVHPLLTKPIEIPGLVRLRSLLALVVGVRAFAVLTITLSLLCGIAYLVMPKAGIQLGALCELIVVFSPLGCLFLIGLLLAAFIQSGYRSRKVFLLGALAGLMPLVVWAILSATSN